MNRIGIAVTAWLAVLALFVTGAKAQRQSISTGLTGSSVFNTGTRSLGQGISGLNRGSSGSSLDQLMSSAGQIQGNERFIQANRQGQFVGADTAEVRNVRSQQGAQGTQRGRGAAGGLGGLTNLLNQLGRSQANNTRGTVTQRRTIRAAVRVGFDYSAPASTAVTARLQSLLQRMPRLQSAGSVSVMAEGSTAVLRGSVDSEHTRQLLARIALLEPGISDVRNELSVGGAEQTDTSSDSASSPPSPSSK